VTNRDDSVFYKNALRVLDSFSSLKEWGLACKVIDIIPDGKVEDKRELLDILLKYPWCEKSQNDLIKKISNPQLKDIYIYNDVFKKRYPVWESWDYRCSYLPREDYLAIMNKHLSSLLGLVRNNDYDSEIKSLLSQGFPSIAEILINKRRVNNFNKSSKEEILKAICRSDKSPIARYLRCTQYQELKLLESLLMSWKDGIDIDLYRELDRIISLPFEWTYKKIREQDLLEYMDQNPKLKYRKILRTQFPQFVESSM
jgi:hypothetical protein